MQSVEIHVSNLVLQVSYISSSIELSDRSRFPNLFRTYPSDADFAPAIVTLIQEYGWRRIAFITQDESLFTEVCDVFYIVLQFDICPLESAHVPPGGKVYMCPRKLHMCYEEPNPCNIS